MNADAPKNAITFRLDKLIACWHEFTQLPEARICRWLIAPDELEMIDILYETETTEHGELADLFLKFEIPFQKLNTYGYALLDDLTRQIQADQEALQEEGITLQWQPLPSDKSLPGSLVFLNNLAAFAGSIEELDGFVVAYLSPEKNESIRQWKQWLIEAVELGIPSQVRLMVVDVNTSPVFDELAKAYPEQIITYEPVLDMPSAMRELSSQGNPADPGVQFRKAFVSLTQAAGKGDFQEVQRLGKAALNIAEKHSWLPMQVTVHATMGGTQLGAKQYDKAFQTYEQARKIAEKAFAEGDPAGGKLAIQAYFSQGATMIAARQYPAAAEAYEQAVPIAQQLEDAFSLMEAWRMAAYCHEAAKAYQRAWECNHRALDAGEKMDEATRASSALPYAGQALQRLTKKLGRSKEQADIYHRMVALIGEDWKDKIQT